MLNSFLNDDSDADFVLVDSTMEQTQEVTQTPPLNELTSSQRKDFRRLRLNPTQLNNLNLSYIEMLGKNEDFTVEEEFNSERIRKITNNGMPFFVFQAVADNKKSRHRNNLAYINQVIREFEQNSPYPHQKTTLLIPLMQCRLWKKHCVLVEVTIEQRQKKINIHDSQSWWRNLFYPNCLKDLKKEGYQIKYSNYAKQADNFSCAYFVYHYIKEIVVKCASDGLKNIFVTLSIFKEKDPIGRLIHDNFKKKYPTIRAIESGEWIPWQNAELKNYFNINNSSILTNPMLDADLERPKNQSIVINSQGKAISKTHFFEPLLREEKKSGIVQSLIR